MVMDLLRGLVGVNFLSGIVYTLPNSPSIFWPSPSVTMAFFQLAVWPTGPMRRRLRRLLPRIETVLTSLTLIPWASYWSSSAFLISVLLADFATLNAYRPWAYSWYVHY